MLLHTNPQETNVRNLRSQLRTFVDRSRMGERIQVISKGTVLAALVCPKDLTALGLDLHDPAHQRSNPQVRNNISEVFHLAAQGHHTLITVHGQVQAGIISSAQLGTLDARHPGAQLTPVNQGGRTLITQEGTVIGALVSLQELRAIERPDKEQPSMQILTFWNESGGATKSTMVAELGYLLTLRKNASQRPNRVLLIDLDPQRSLTHRMGLLDDPDSKARRLGSTLNTILQESDNDFPTPFTPARMPGLLVVPAHQQLRSLDTILLSDDQLLVGLRNALMRLHGEYDYVLIDTPPSNGGITRAALVASNYAVIPMPTHVKSVENLENVTSVLTQCRRLNPQLQIAAFIPTTYNKGRVQDREILDLMHTRLATMAPITPAITERPALFRDVIPSRGAVGLDQPRNPATAELNAVLDQLIDIITRNTAAGDAA